MSLRYVWFAQRATPNRWKVVRCNEYPKPWEEYLMGKNGRVILFSSFSAAKRRATILNMREE